MDNDFKKYLLDLLQKREHKLNQKLGLLQSAMSNNKILRIHKEQIGFSISGIEVELMQIWTLKLHFRYEVGTNAETDT